MIPETLVDLTAELTSRREPFVTATVVRVQHPASVNPGATAVVRVDGTISGFVGGVCAQHSVRLYSLRAMESNEPVLLRIIPDPDQPDPDAAPVDAGEEIAREEGAVTVRNPCLSGGAIEVFLEPTLPAPRVVVVGDSPIVGALAKIGPEVGLQVATSEPGRGSVSPVPGDLGLVVAAHGRGELEVLRAGLEAELPYVGLVASPKRGAAVLDELAADGVSRELLERVDTPAGLEIGASTPGEIALAIAAQIVRLRRASALPTVISVPTVVTAVDPICGMTVTVTDDTPSAERDGETYYFCCEGCQRAFIAQQAA